MLSLRTSYVLFAFCSQFLVHPAETRDAARRRGGVAQPWMGSGSLGDGVAVPASRIDTRERTVVQRGVARSSPLSLPEDLAERP